jgi:hypothetical protein
MNTLLNDLTFCITDEFNDIEFTDDQYVLLNLPSELTYVLLCSDWWKQKYRELNFTNTTNKQAIEKILTFYKHKTFRRLIGDHIFFEGFDTVNDLTFISLGS